MVWRVAGQPDGIKSKIHFQKRWLRRANSGHAAKAKAIQQKQLQEKCREQNKGLYVTFVDLTKAFDTVSRKDLWLIMGAPRLSPKFLQLHEDQHGQVRLNSDLSKPFRIANGVKQGCVLTLTLFSIFFSMMLKQAMEDLDGDNAVYIRYRLDRTLFNLGDCRPTKRLLSRCFETFSLLTTLPLLPISKVLCSA